jgi:hypothetical protein
MADPYDQHITLLKKMRDVAKEEFSNSSAHPCKHTLLAANVYVNATRELRELSGDGDPFNFG